MALENKLGIESDVERGTAVDWSLVDRKDCLLAMERSPVRDTEIKGLLKTALTNKVSGLHEGRRRELPLQGLRHLHDGRACEGIIGHISRITREVHHVLQLCRA